MQACSVRPCLDCGTPTTGSRCPTHRKAHERARRPNSTRAGYDRQWRKVAREFYGLPCHYCGRPSDTVDHVVPKSRGGSADLSNLVPACRACNSGKRDRLTN